MSWRETLRTGVRGGAHAPAALGADHARHPDRHRRGDPHRRPRPRRAGRRSATRSTRSARNLLVVSPGQHAPAPRGVRGGFGSASTLTTADADALAVAGGRARHRGGRRRRRPRSASLTAGTHELDHDASSGTTPSWPRCAPARWPTGRFLTDADDADAARRSSCSGPTPPPSCSAPRDVGRPDGDDQRHALKVVGVLDAAGLVRTTPTTTTWRSSRSTHGRSGWSAGPAATRCQTIYVKATLGRHAVGGLPGGRRAAAQPARHHRRRRRRLHDRHARSRCSPRRPRSTRR